MTHFLLRYRRHGNHVNVKFFAAAQANLTHAKLGALTLHEKEWEAFSCCFSDRGEGTITIIPDDEHPLTKGHPISGNVRTIDR